MSIPLEQDYIGLSQITSMEKRTSQNPTEINKTNTLLLNLKETELRLGLPGSDSPVSVKNFVSGAKRGFSHSDLFNSVLLNNDKTEHHQNAVLDDKKNSPPNLPPAAKAQVVGWPPIRSFRKNTMSTNNNNVTKKPSAEIVVETNNSNNGCVFVKVSMDGAPYLRKVDLKTFSNYAQLSSALENMFTCFTIGQCSSHGVPGREGLTASRLMDIVSCSEYVLTYEDKDSDWMLVGDVPWEMFTNSCKRLRIMKGSEAIGLAPRAMEKCKNQK